MRFNQAKSSSKARSSGDHATPGVTSSNTIRLHANMFLHALFRQRGWANPSLISVEAETPALALLASLQIPAGDVGVIYVNGKPYSSSRAVVRPGDRVALFSPGAPMFLDLGSHERAYGLVDESPRCVTATRQ